MNDDDNDDRLEVYCDIQIMMAFDGDSQKFLLISQLYYEACHINRYLSKYANIGELQSVCSLIKVFPVLMNYLT